MPIGVNRAMPIETEQAFADLLLARAATEREAVVAISKRTSGKQTVRFDQFLEVAFCHGWVDVQTKTIDAERYAIRFSPRRTGSALSARNRAVPTRLLAEGKMTAAGRAALPEEMCGPT